MLADFAEQQPFYSSRSIHRIVVGGIDPNDQIERVIPVQA
jgi:hypothetical protein